MKVLGLACGASLVAIAWVAAGGCGGSAFLAGDSGTDASTPTESGPAPEAGEGAAPGDSGARWCTAHTETFCEDFDEYSSVNNLLGSNTWPTNAQQAGSFTFDTVNAPSPPNALQVAGDDGAQVYVVHTFPALQQAPTKLVLSFDLRVNSGGDPGLLSVAGFAAIAFGTSITDGYVALAIGAGPSLAAFWVQSTSNNPAADAGAFKPAPLSGAFPSTGVWDGTYAVEIDYAPPSPPCLQVYRGVLTQLASCVPLPPEFAQPQIVSIMLGDVAGGTGKTGPINLEFDNVTFNIK